MLLQYRRAAVSLKFVAVYLLVTGAQQTILQSNYTTHHSRHSISVMVASYIYKAIQIL